jgi:undecaprenyl-diphosphatase
MRQVIQNILKLVSEHRIASLAGYFAVFLLLIVGFIEIAEEVFQGETLWFDEAMLNAINGFSSTFFDTFFIIVTQFGGVLGSVAITLGIVSLLAYRRNYKKAIIVGATVAGAALLNVVLKLIFERIRPNLWEQLIVETSFSFPSGHAMISSALALSIIYIFWATKYRWAALVLGGLFIVIIGFSRLYLGVHYPTDILAGWIVSGAWLSIVLLIINSRHIYTHFHKVKTPEKV